MCPLRSLGELDALNHCKSGRARVLTICPSDRAHNHIHGRAHPQELGVRSASDPSCDVLRGGVDGELPIAELPDGILTGLEIELNDDRELLGNRIEDPEESEKRSPRYGRVRNHLDHVSGDGDGGAACLGQKSRVLHEASNVERYSDTPCRRGLVARSRQKTPLFSRKKITEQGRCLAMSPKNCA